MHAKEHIDELLKRNGNVLSTDGDKIGSIGQVYADDENGQPTWVTAKTGLFGTSESFVPLEGARVEGATSSSRTPRIRSRTPRGWTATGTSGVQRRTGSTATTV